MSTAPKLYFLVRPGGSLRAEDRGGVPVKFTEDAVKDAIAHYERLVPMPKRGPLEAIEVEEYHRRFGTAPAEERPRRRGREQGVQ